ncbi:YbhN family protein [Gillisia sp. Q332]|uniref:lysylphosphatidylglycerol synthase transmembrane domain-containing protein n=1 Tax=Gillisia xinjiangensis TaxID=3384765 RepID=UPI003918DC42
MNRKYILLKRFLYFSLPLILLFFIFKKVDFSLLFSLLEDVNLVYIILALAIMPISIVLGSGRWYLLNNFYNKKPLSFRYISFHYWAGLAIGYFTPGNIGWDAYRIIAVGKKLKTYTSPVITIVSEKFIGFLSVSLMILIVFPLIEDHLLKDGKLYNKIYFGGSGILALVILFGGLILKGKGENISDWINSSVCSLILKFSKLVKLKKLVNLNSLDFTQSRSLLSGFKNPKLLFSTFFISWGILIISALSNQFLFRALGYEIDFSINLFAAPVFFILFLIPLSFGSLGVREGVYIVFYDQFGVPMEIALLVSFLSLIGILLNNALGAGNILINGFKKLKKD